MISKLLSIPILLSLLIVGCAQPVSVTEEGTCETIVKNMGDSVDSNLDTHNFAAKIGMYVEGLNKRDLPKTSGENSKKCAKAQAIQCLLESYNGIDLVRITPSCHGVSYRVKEDQTWGNIFVNNKGEG
jgi:hypothetical protein